MSLSSLAVVESNADSYDDLLQMFLNAAATWINCNEVVIRSRFQLLMRVFRACNQPPESIIQLKLKYDGELIEPTEGAYMETFTTAEIEVLSACFRTGTTTWLAAKSSLTPEFATMTRMILMLPNAAGVVRAETWTPKKMTDSGMKALAVVYKSSLKHRRYHTMGAVIPPLIKDLSRSIAPDPVVVTMEEDHQKLSQPALQLRQEANTPSLEQEVLPYDELIEGIIIALNLHPATTRTASRSLKSAQVAWNNGTVEELTVAEVIDACEVAHSLENVTIKHASIGSPVAKVFQGRLYYGQVVYFAPDDTLYHVEWSDGDAEDLDWDEFRHATALYSLTMNKQALLSQFARDEKRKYIFREGYLSLTVNMKVARIVPLVLRNTLPISAGVANINAEEVYIIAKTVNGEEESLMVNHPSIGKAVCRLLSVRNRDDNTVHRNLLLSGIVNGYIGNCKSCGGGELYRVKWESIDEQQWLNYMEIAKCTPLKQEAIRDMPPKKKRCLNKQTQGTEAVVEEM